jgi:hypothetical protein
MSTFPTTRAAAGYTARYPCGEPAGPGERR